MLKYLNVDLDSFDNLTIIEIKYLLIGKRDKAYILEDIVITEDNIADYYEFMSDEDKKLNIDIIDSFLSNRLYNVTLLVGVTNWHNFLVKDFLDNNSTSYCGYSLFGVKDTLKPLEEYLAEIKSSNEYKAYMLDACLTSYNQDSECEINSMFEVFTFTDLDNSSYVSSSGENHDLRDYVNVTGFDISFDVAEDECYIVNMLDVRKILGE